MNLRADLAERAPEFVSPQPGATIIYDDRATGLRAKGFCDRLATTLGGAGMGGLKFWRSELLAHPEVVCESARDAAKGEFVILSLRGDACLTSATKDWLESWLAGASGGPSVLIALFDPERSTASHAEAARGYLRQVAARAGVGFFSHCTVAPDDEARFAADEPWTTAPRAGTTLASFFPRPNVK